MKRALPVLIAVACASPRPAAPPREYPGSLVDSREIAGEFMMRQRVEAHYPGRTMGFDAVLQRRDGELTLLGLTPFGTRAFVLTQRGRALDFSTALPLELPFPPRYMLMDIHRVFFITLGPAPAQDGERVETRDGEEIRETWRGGRLLRRSYRRLDGQPPGLIEVDYGEGMINRSPPRVIRFTNGWYGYRLEITTLAHQTLAPRAPADGGT